MANYLLQPDGSRTCCDCSARSGPCDTCSASCPDVSTLSVAFSGITLCSGCLDGQTLGFGVSIDNLTAIGTINGTFTVTRYFTGDPEGWTFTTADNRINYDIWNTPAGEFCAGLPNANESHPLIPLVWCGSAKHWQVWLLNDTSFALFYATSASKPNSLANTCICGSTVPDATGGTASPDFCIGHGGTVTVT